MDRGRGRPFANVEFAFETEAFDGVSEDPTPNANRFRMLNLDDGVNLIGHGDST